MLKKGFTLIEMVIVIGIIGILIAALIMALDPSEGQAKARDLKRMKDLNTISSILEQFVVMDKRSPTGSCLSSSAGCISTGGSIACDNNWLNENVCQYAQSIPIDPSNNLMKNVVTGGTVDNPLYAMTGTYYQVKISGINYEVNVRQESASNLGNITSDAGNSNLWSEGGTDLTLF